MEANIDATDFETSRREGIGGSDWRDLLNLAGGCARRLWYQKRGQQPDYPPNRPGWFERGHVLEQIVAEHAADYLGVSLHRPGRLPRTSLPEWWIGNPDRLVVPDGIWEGKTKGPFPFRKLTKEGVPDHEVLQCQHYVGLADRRQALYSCLEPVSWEFYHAQFERDDGLIEKMVSAGNTFWEMVTTESHPGPDRLDAAARSCQSCEFRWTCQGVRLLQAADKNIQDINELPVLDDPDLARLVYERDDLTDLIREAEQLKDQNADKIKAVLKGRFGGPVKVICDGRSVYWIAYERGGFDSSRFKKDHKDLWEEYQKKPTVVEQLRVY